jgi:serine/threonine protein kinase, bacterial
LALTLLPTIDAHPTDAEEPPTSNRITGSQLIGKVLQKKYLFQALLARGAFGLTFLARIISLPGQPLCVIKKLEPKVDNPANHLNARWRFYLEARSLSRLGAHCQIPTLIDYFKLGQSIYLVEEYIPGQTLDVAVKNSRCFTQTEVENFLLQMLRLLEFIHSNRLIHRDVKPQNIILSSVDRRLVLLDFGAVKDLDPPPKVRYDRIISQGIGTPGYAPPEQLADRTVYASDLYGLGMTCLFLLTGISPRQLPTDPQTCEILWNEDIAIEPSLQEIIAKMVRVSVGDRYQTAAQAISALESRAIKAKLAAYNRAKQAWHRSIPLPEFSEDQVLEQFWAYPDAVRWAIEKTIE